MDTSTDTMDCAKCPCPIYRSSSLYTTCRGPCNKPYHALCADISSNVIKVLSESKSAFWLCDECSIAFEKWKLDVPSSPAIPILSPVEMEVAELKSQVSSIIDTLASITSKLALSSPSVSPSRVASSTLLDGTNENSDKCTAVPGKIEARVKNSSKDFSLLLTNVSNSTSEEDICTIVSRCLDAPKMECRKIRKLVPKWVDVETLDYLSFKVDLNERWKSQALDAATWPRGMKFREFWKRSNCTWEPDRQ